MASLIFLTEQSETYFLLEKALLERAGMRVERVAHDDVLDMMVACPAVVVLDLGQRGEGLQIAEEIRRREETRRQSILGTGLRGYLSREDVQAKGVNRLLWKPFSPVRFVDDVTELIHVPERHPVDLTVELRSRRPGSPSLRGKALNFSASGILLQCEERLDVGHRLVVHGDARGGRLALDAVVVRHAHERGPGHYGLKFRRGRSVGREALERLRLASV